MDIKEMTEKFYENFYALHKNTYKLYKNTKELKSTCYFEFLPSKFQEEYWNNNSVFLSEVAICLIDDLLKKANEDFWPYSNTYYNEEQINILKNELLQRLNEIKNDINFRLKEETVHNGHYLNDVNNDIVKCRNKIIKIFEDLINWLETINSNEITILGI
jgi:hypothetical protein